MQLNTLSPNPENPRLISAEKLAMLKGALAEFGDLGGIVYNRKTKRLVGGHQRQKVFGRDAKVEITKKFPKPTKTGTVAIGLVEINGETFSYREVSWDTTKEKAANIAANQGAGEWDAPRLASWLDDIGELGFDLNLTMFDEDEREALRNSVKVKTKTKKAVEPEEDEGPKKKKRVVCPECQHKFVPGWSE